MANIKEIMRGRQRLQKQSSFSQRDLTPTSTGNIRGRTDAPKSDMSTFFDAIMKTAPGVMDAWNKQKNVDNAKDKKQGFLDMKNATPESLKEFRDKAAIQDNPYYDIGVKTAEATITLSKLAPSYELEYKKWKVNTPIDGPQTKEEFDDTWIETNKSIINPEGSNPNIIAEHFLPGMEAVMNAKSTDYSNYEATIYAEETARVNQQAMFVQLEKHQTEAVLRENSASTMAEYLDSEKEISKSLSLLQDHIDDSKKLNREETTDVNRWLASSFNNPKQTTQVAGRPSIQKYVSEFKTELKTNPYELISYEYAQQVSGNTIAESEKAKEVQVSKQTKKKKRDDVEVGPPLQTWGMVSFGGNTEKTANLLGKMEKTWGTLLKTSMYDNSLPETAFATVSMETYKNTGDWQIVLKMPTKEILAKYPQAEKVNKSLMKKLMETHSITTEISDNGKVNADTN